MSVPKKNCNKGYGCGRTCITRTRNCHSNLDANGIKISENYTQFALRIAGESLQASIDDLPRSGSTNIAKAALEQTAKTDAALEKLKKIAKPEPKPEPKPETLETLAKAAIEQKAQTDAALDKMKKAVKPKPTASATYSAAKDKPDFDLATEENRLLDKMDELAKKLGTADIPISEVRKEINDLSAEQQNKVIKSLMEKEEGGLDWVTLEEDEPIYNDYTKEQRAQGIADEEGDNIFFLISERDEMSDADFEAAAQGKPVGVVDPVFSAETPKASFIQQVEEVRTLDLMDKLIADKGENFIAISDLKKELNDLSTEQQNAVIKSLMGKDGGLDWVTVEDIDKEASKYSKEELAQGFPDEDGDQIFFLISERHDDEHGMSDEEFEAKAQALSGGTQDPIDAIINSPTMSQEAKAQALFAIFQQTDPGAVVAAKTQAEKELEAVAKAVREVAGKL